MLKNIGTHTKRGERKRGGEIEGEKEREKLTKVKHIYAKRKTHTHTKILINTLRGG